MNAPFSVAQAPSLGTTAGTRTLQTIKVLKPQGDQAVTLQLGYDQNYKLDLTAIANEKITLVHIGEKLIILFDNKSTVTVEPFFDSMSSPLSNVTVEAAGREFTGSEFASAFPITTDQSVLTAAGVAGANGSPASGADFRGSSVDPLGHSKPLDLLGQEELPNWKTDLILTSVGPSTTAAFNDHPTANPDSNWVRENGGFSEGPQNGSSASGNVLTNQAHNGAPAGVFADVADNDGADGFGSIAWTGATAGHVTGLYGTLTVDANGHYTYVLNNSNPAVVALNNGDTLNDTFTYTVTDGSGDTSTTTLTITVFGNDSGVTIGGLNPAANGGDTSVNEANLSDGSAPNAGALTQGGSFTISTPDGLDDLTVGGHAVITNGVFAATSFTTPDGNTLSFTGFNPATGVVTYTYTLNDNAAHDPVQGTNDRFENFTVVLTDIDGSSATDTLSIDIVDDVPTARNDADSVTENGITSADGNVITGIGGSDANATDGTADTAGADGIASIAWAGQSGNTVGGAHGALTIDANGNYSYQLANLDPAVVALGNGDSLTDTFTYTITDADGDTATATLTITINGSDNGVTIGGLTPAANGGDTSVNEANLADGSAPNAGALTQGGNFTISTPDGLDDLTVGGHAVITDGVFAASSFTTPDGNTLTFTGFNPATGVVTYTYTLNDNAAHNPVQGTNDLFENFTVVLTDIDGSSATDTLSIDIVDDVPTARNDADSVKEDGATIADGNVITGIGGSDANATDGTADTAGADGIASIAWAGQSGNTVGGAHGTLTIDANGNYSYALTNSDPAVQALSNGQSLTEVFTYTVTDADGDSSAATLTITINGTDDGVTISGLNPEANGGDASVNEANLADGSAPNVGALTQGGNFTISTPDGLDDLTVGGHAVITDGVFAASSFTTPDGNTLTFTGFNPATGVVTYTYTLLDNEGHSAGNGTNSLFENFAVVLTDKDGSSANDTLSINIVDDVPTANNDTNWVSQGHTTTTGNVFANVDHSGAPAGSFADHADVVGADGLSNWLGASGGSLTGLYGTVTGDPSGNGGYTYVLDASNPAVAALANGQTLSDTFSYWIIDGDGDSSSASLTFTIFGGDHGVTITNLTPAANGGDASVNEANLVNGSAPNAAALTQGGNFTISTPDGLDDLTVGGHAVITNGVFAATSFTTPDGNTLSFTGFNPATGVVSYTYTLLHNAAHSVGNGTNNLFENFSVVLTDVDGSSASDTLSVRIVDDVPTARNDADSVKEDGPTVADGNVITGIGGSDANTTDGVADTAGADGVTSIAWTGAAGSTVTGSFGTLTLSGLGGYSYALNNSNATVQHLSNGETLTETFTYTIADADGDSSSATLTVTINGTDDGVTITNLTPSANGGDATVFEANLATGSTPNAAALTQVGTFNISAPDGLDDLTVGGHAVITNGVFAATSFATPDGSTLSFTGFNAATGVVTYSYTLQSSQIHPTGNGNNSLFENFAVTLTDKDGSTASNTLSINIVDDAPAANAVTKNLAALGHDTNIMLILDVSGSMDDASGLTGLSRLDVLKASVGELLEQYGDIGNVRVQIVDFSTDAAQAGTNWMTIDQAKAAVDALSAGGNTNYDAALTLAQSLFTQSGKLTTAGVQNVSYFMSDGEPNTPSNSAGINAAEESTWTSFLNTNNVSSFALGMGTGVTQSALDPVAYDGQGHSNTNSIVVSNMAQLTQTLVSTISGTTGNLLTDGVLPNSFGADGGYIKSVTIDGTVYTFNPGGAGSISVTGTDHGSFNASTHVETVNISSGATFSLDMDTGSYNYVAPVNVGSAYSDVIQFNLADNDGDAGPNSLTVNVTTQDHHPIVRDDHVITNASNQSGLDQIIVPDYALLFNDSDTENQAIAITGVSNANDGSVSHAGVLVTFTEESNGANDGGSFTYTGTANGLTDTGDVIVDRSQTGTTLTGTGLDEILIGRDGSNNTINANEGNDVLIGGNGNDSLNGGVGNDLLVGGAGNDTYTFGLNDGVDTINDTSGSNDAIRVTASGAALTGFDVTTSGNDLVIQFNGETITIQNHFSGSAIETMTFVGGASYNGFTLSSSAYNLNTDNTNPFTGTAGSDIIGGDNTAQTLSGGGSSDLLFGNGGNDTLNGGSGADLLVGGAGSDRFVFAPSDSGQTTGNIDVIADYAKGAVGVGDVIDYSSSLVISSTGASATSSQAVINQTTGVATFASGSGTTLADALNDVANAVNVGGTTQGEFALFKVNGTGDFHLFISDNVAGVSANDVVVQLFGVTTIGSIQLNSGDLTIAA